MAYETAFVITVKSERARENLGGIKVAFNDVSKSAAKMDEVVNRAAGNLKKSISSIRDRLASLGIDVSFQAVARSFLDVETPLSRMVGLLGRSRKQVAEYRRDIDLLARTVGIFPGKLADALLQIGTLGLRGPEAFEALTSSAMASAAGLGEIKPVASVVVAALEAYREKGLNAAAATDVMMQAFREAKVEPPQFLEALEQIFKKAKGSAVNFTDLAASFATLTSSVESTSEAVGNLDDILTALEDGSEKGEDALEKLELTYADLRENIAESGFPAALRDLWDSLGGNEKAFADILGGFDAVKAALKLMVPLADGVAGSFERVGNATGVMDAAFEERERTVGHELGKAGSDICR